MFLLLNTLEYMDLYIVLGINTYIVTLQIKDDYTREHD